METTRKTKRGVAVAAAGQAGDAAAPGAGAGRAAGGGHQNRGRRGGRGKGKGKGRGKRKRPDAPYDIKKASTIVHSMVASLKMRFSTGDLATAEHQEIILPAVPVNATDHETVGKALLNTIQSKALPKELSEFATDTTAWCCLVCIIVLADSASSNLKLIRMMQCYFQTNANILFWFERCNLHQLSRVHVALSKRLGLSRHFRALSILLRQRRARKAFEIQRQKVVEHNLRANAEVVPYSPEQVAQHKIEQDMLKKLLTTKSVQEEAQGEALPAEFLRLQKSNEDRDKLIDISNNGPLGGMPSILRPGESKANIVVDYIDHLDAAVPMDKVPVYQESRWLQLLPSEMWWGVCLLVSNVARVTWLTVTFSCDKKNNAKADDDDDPRAKDGVRVAAGRVWLRDQTLNLKVVVLLHLTVSLEKLTKIFFFVSGAMITADGKMVPRSEAKRKRPSDTSLDTAVRETERTMSEIWCCFNGRGEGEQARSLQVLSDRFWPTELGDAQKFEILNGSFCCVEGELYMRLLMRHEEYPYLMAGYPDGAWPTVARKFLASFSCCSMELEAFRTVANDDTRPGTPEDKLKRANTEFRVACGVSTLAEERWHHDQTAQARTDKSPLSFARQASTGVRRGVQFLWYKLGGRDLAKATSELSEMWRMVNEEGPDHNRPKQVGSAFISWAAEVMTAEAPSFNLLKDIYM